MRIGEASDIDPGFGSPRMYPAHSVPTALHPGCLHPGWTRMLETLSLCIHLAVKKKEAEKKNLQKQLNFFTTQISLLWSLLMGIDRSTSSST
jgi:hypothetical protein